MTAEANDRLTEAERASGYVLACRTTVRGDVHDRRAPSLPEERTLRSLVPYANARLLEQLADPRHLSARVRKRSQRRKPSA